MEYKIRLVLIKAALYNDVLMHYIDYRINKSECDGNNQYIGKKKSDQFNLDYNIVIIST